MRIGLGSVPHDDLGGYVDACEAAGVDSVWLPDFASTDAVDPLVGLAYAAGRTRRLKLGTGVLVLPGRNPMLVAAQLASLVALAPKRILPTFGVRAVSVRDRALYPVPGERAAVFDEALLVLRRLLSEPSVTHHGEFFHLDDAAVGPLPPRPLDLWLGGTAPVALRRIGRLADGWLGAAVTPAEAGGCRAGIERAAADADREIEDDHYGTNIGLLPPGTSEADRAAALAQTARRRPDVDPALLVADGWAAARTQVRAFVDVGLTKFVVRPLAPVASWRGFVDEFVAELGPEQT
ncbi:TIGR03854 family LLM class F420-dependent oxidoreductase [Pseudonocardia petroleophila]|uniref:TIGR03854 family LLM class F420-dependent oxidoreductase n=1 Tax=Pseudonocardia petroleophila TaxID=37331 RepID=A0A7G7MSJ8_9PSEU|nr:TIGR03854 family LLM class F420-dependent oxidoreductase [Pseudonocardia petroleophila]